MLAVGTMLYSRSPEFIHCTKLKLCILWPAPPHSPLPAVFGSHYCAPPSMSLTILLCIPHMRQIITEFVFLCLIKACLLNHYTFQHEPEAGLKGHLSLAFFFPSFILPPSCFSVLLPQSLSFPPFSPFLTLLSWQVYPFSIRSLVTFAMGIDLLLSGLCL